MSTTAIKTLEMIIPDDWHLHLRQGNFLADTVRASAQRFRRAIIMPNLSIPVTTVALAEQYRAEIIDARNALSADASWTFEPLMTLYLTDQSTVAEIEKAATSPVVYGIKMYPRNATTKSSYGVSAPKRLHHLYEAMARCEIPLLIHGEVTDPEVDVYDREKVFIDQVLLPILAQHPKLQVVLEHITTCESVAIVTKERARMMATITPHHLWLNRNALFPNGRINPHHHCLPVLKRERHRQALVEAATSGMDCFAAGTDSAPHLQTDKESACGCAGIYNAPCALETYVEIFEQANALEHLEAFLCRHGARFYRVETNPGAVRLSRQSWTMPDQLSMGEGRCVPFRAGQKIAWKIDGIDIPGSPQ